MGGEGKSGKGGMRFATMLVLGVLIGLGAVWVLMQPEDAGPSGTGPTGAVAAGKAPLTTHATAIDAAPGATAGPVKLGAAGQRVELSPGMASAGAAPIEAGPERVAPLPPGQGAGLAGRVVDRGGRPIEGAKVELRGVRKDQPMAMTMVKTGAGGPAKLQIQGERAMGPETTGPDGRYAFQGLEPGVRWRIEVAPPEKSAGFLPGSGRAPDLIAGQTAQAADVQLSRAASLSGVALRPDGTPAAGARVLLGALDGPFAALDFAEGEEVEEPVPAPQGKPGAGAGKQVVAKQARGMMFSIGGAGPDFMGAQPIETRADEQGRWRIESAPPGKHGLQAQLRGCRPARTEVDLEEGREKSGVELRLAEGLVLRVRVVDTAGNAVAKARVMVMGKGGRGVETGQDGKVELPGLASAEAMLMVEAEGYAPCSGPVQVPEESQTPVEVVLRKGATLVGTVLKKSDRSAVTGGNVWLEPLVHGGRMEISMRGDDGKIAEGRFKLPGVLPGRWRLHAQHPRLAEVTKDVEVPANTEVVDVGELLLGELGKIAVTVVDPSGAPVEGAEVQLGFRFLGGGGGGMMVMRATSVATEDEDEGDDEPPAFRGMGRTLRTDAAGKALLPGVQPGKTTVQATKDGWAPAYSEEVLVAEDGSTVEVTLRLSPGGRVTGKVRGAFTPGEAVFLLRKNNPIPAGQQMVDAAGAFAFERVTPGTYRLGLASGMKPGGGGQAPQWFEVRDEETVTRDLEADARATLEGSVKDAAGRPVVGAEVGLGPLMPPGMGTIRPMGGGGTVVTDAAGRYRLEGLQVVGREQALTVTVPGGEPETFRMLIDRAGTLRRDVVLAGGAAAGELSVDVTGPDGQPARGEPVELESLDPDRPLVRRETPTDGAGRARFEGLPPGRYALTAGRAPNARGRVEATVGEAPVQAGTIALVAGGTLAVELVAGGADRASVEVIAAGEPPRFSFGAAGETVRVGGLTPGREYAVTVRADGFTPFQSTVRVQGGETPVRVALQPAGPR